MDAEQLILNQEQWESGYNAGRRSRDDRDKAIAQRAKQELIENICEVVGIVDNQSFQYHSWFENIIAKHRLINPYNKDGMSKK